MPEAQAGVLAEEQTRLLDDRLVTKEDWGRTETSVKSEFSSVRADMKAEFVSARSEMKAEFTAVRSDLTAVESGLKTDVAKLETSFKSDMRELELRMTVKLGGLIVAAVGILLAAIRYLPGGHP